LEFWHESCIERGDEKKKKKKKRRLECEWNDLDLILALLVSAVRPAWDGM
jgi:hypothetical protein